MVIVAVAEIFVVSVVSVVSFYVHSTIIFVITVDGQAAEMNVSRQRVGLSKGITTETKEETWSAGGTLVQGLKAVHCCFLSTSKMEVVVLVVHES